MCRGFQQSSESERVLKMKTFNINFSLKTPSSSTLSTFPDSLTLYYLPRINGTPLEINHSTIKPNSPAFITLHRVIDSYSTQVVSFSSRERVKASQGARFEVYFGDIRIIKGFFTKVDYLNDAWKMECACGLECGLGGRKLQEAVEKVVVQVAAEGGVEMSETVEMVAKRRRRRAVESGMLEEIPEETEDINSSCVCDCWRCDEEELVDDECDGGGDMVVVEEMDDGEVSWAVDVGIWVMCLGVGLLVSRASSKRLVRYTNKFL